jgi:uncharacterized membrane protein
VQPPPEPEPSAAPLPSPAGAPTPPEQPITVTIPPGTGPEALARLATQLTLHAGPLPPPEVLEAYGRIVPNGAERIMAMAERQASHRQELERAVILANIRRANWGLGAGLIVALAFLGASYSLIMAGHTVEGTVLGTVDLVALAGVFIYGSQAQQAERLEKARRGQQMSEREAGRSQR